MGMAAESEFHVLAVDDSIIDRKLIEKLLKTSSYQVTTVDSGSKALEFLGLHEDDDQNNHNPPSISPNNPQQEVEVNLVITDYCMPGMTGYDLLKKIKESSSLRNIPVVIMSSENVPARITRCLEEGAEQFLLKPVRPSDLEKLKSHMMKTKIKNQNLKQEPPLQPPPPPPPSQQQPQQPSSQQQQLPPPQPQQPPPPQQSPAPQQHLSSNKRKTMEEGLSADRTRPRFNDIATVV